MIEFTIPGEPIAKARARHIMRNGQARSYTPAKTVSYEQRVAAYAGMAMATAGKNTTNDPVSVSIGVYMPIPKSWPKKRLQAALSGGKEAWHATRPDIDNLTKSIFDGMNGIVFKDDAQVGQLIITKRYGLEPRVVVIVHVLGVNTQK